jgi:hypothetical protein
MPDSAQETFFAKIEMTAVAGGPALPHRGMISR